MKKLVFFVMTLFIFINCSATPQTTDLAKLSDKNIQKITISYQVDESSETFVETDVSKEYWDSLITELMKPKKKVGIFTSVRNPGDITFSITILYENNKETQIDLFQYNYYSINNEWYYYGNRSGPDFKIIYDITGKEKPY